jgi:Flp pilus assembly protein TadG
MMSRAVSKKNRLKLTSFQHRKRQESGAAVVEGALVFGIFMMIILALIEFGFFFIFWSTGRNGASEAAHEVAIGGKANFADYSALYASRNQLKRTGKALEFIIIYRAKNIKDVVPPACVAAAVAGSSSPATTPVGVFDPGSMAGNPETFPWKTAVPAVACNIYYSRSIDLIPDQKLAFDYSVLKATNGNPGLSRFWPSIQRRDSLNGPVDFVGIYIRSTYNSLTGIVPTRKVNHNAIVQIEPRSTN